MSATLWISMDQADSSYYPCPTQLTYLFTLKQSSERKNQYCSNITWAEISQLQLLDSLPTSFEARYPLSGFYVPT